MSFGQPAIAYAENGFKILPGEAFRQQMAKEVLQQYEGTKTHFLNAEGASFQAGDQVVQKTLASVLCNFTLIKSCFTV